MSNKRYPEELKIEAVKQVAERGHTGAGVPKHWTAVASLIRY